MTLNEIANTPMDQLRFRDFLNLKVPSGRDEFSRMRFAQLVSKVSENEMNIIREMIKTEKNQATCIRWYLRGLPLEKAIRKTMTDIEVATNAVIAKMGV